MADTEQYDYPYVHPRHLDRGHPPMFPVPVCAGCGRYQVAAARVLCTPCAGLLASSTPIAWAAPTVNVAAAPTLRVPAYIPAA